MYLVINIQPVIEDIRFNPIALHLGSVIERVDLEQFSSRYFLFPLQHYPNNRMYYLVH